MMSEENNKQGVSNPIADMEVNLSFPQGIDINMVDVSTIRDFEIWGVITSIMSNFVVGILVGAITASEETVKSILYGFTFVFSIFTVGGIFMTYFKRKKMKVNTKTMKMNLRS